MQLAGVQYVLDTVTQALALNQDRTFIYGEIVSPVSGPLQDVLRHACGLPVSCHSDRQCWLC